MLFLQLQKPDTEGIEAGLESTVSNARESVTSFLHMSWPERWDALSDWAIHTGWAILQIAVIVFICRWLIKQADKLLDKIFVRRRVDSSINTFIRSMLRIICWLLVLVFIVGVLGVKTTSIAALVAAAGFAAGMALSGTLQNFAGGIMILLLKPFRTGDYIQAQGNEGTIKQIKLFNTVMLTADNKTVIIPNGGLSTNIVNNFSSSGTRRVEWTFGMTFGSDYDSAEGTMREILDNDARILQSPPYFIALKGLDGGVMSIVARAWVSTGDFWDVFYDVNERVYKLFPLRGLALVSGSGGVSVNINGMPTEATEPSPAGKRSAPNTSASGRSADKATGEHGDQPVIPPVVQIAVPGTVPVAGQTAAKPVEDEQTRDMENKILTKCSDMKSADNSAASMNDSHEKMNSCAPDNPDTGIPLNSDKPA